MALQSLCAMGSAPAATGNTSITGVGFQPKALIIMSVDKTVTGGFEQGGNNGMGFAASSTNEAGVCCFNRNNQNPTNAAGHHTFSSCLISMSNGPGTRLKADLVSFDADGFTLNFATTATTRLYNYMCLGGADVTNAKVVQFQSPAGTGAQSVTGVGFTPSTVIFMGNGSSGAVDVQDNTRAEFFHGHCDSSLNQYSSSIFMEDNVATNNTSKMHSTTKAITIVGASETTRFAAAVTSLDSDGFTLNWSTTAGSGTYFYALCLGGVSSYAATFTQKSGGTGTQAITGSSITPKALFFCGGSTSGSEVASAIASRFSGMTCQNLGNLGINTIESDNLVMPNSTYTWHSARNDNCLTLGVEASGTTYSFLAAVTSLDASGFTLNWGTNDSAARTIGYLAMGDAPAGGAAGGFKSSLYYLGVGG